MRNKVSIVIPVFNEEKNIYPLMQKLLSVVRKVKAEIVFVNDGSTDETEKEILKFKDVVLVNFRRNFGQTAALMAGIHQAKGEVIITMDGDGQNDPRDIPKLLDKLDEGFDVICGWRKTRKDPWVKKTISRGADLLRKMILRDEIHDSGCTLKVYRRECFDGLDLYGEMHRFIPAILAWKGYRIAEMPVWHHVRRYGKTKYNMTRTMKGFIDMVNVWFWYRFSARPLHLFGGIGLLLGLFGVIVLVWMLGLKLLYGVSLAEKVWPLVGFFSILAGIQLFVSGILADIAIKSYFNSPKRNTYSVRSVKKL